MVARHNSLVSQSSDAIGASLKNAGWRRFQTRIGIGCALQSGRSGFGHMWGHKRCQTKRLRRVDSSRFAIVQRPSDQPTTHPGQPFVVSPLIPHRLPPGGFVPRLVRKRSSGAVAARCIARPTIAASSADSHPHPWKNHRQPGERCRATWSNSRPSAGVRLSQATGSPSCGLRVRRQVLMRTRLPHQEGCKRP